jgi:lysophospholipase L1-like esterase
MLLGDSTIFGLGASLTGYGYRTIDLSFRGQTMREVRQSLPESLLNEPRAIIVAAGLNDIATVGHRTAASSDVDEAALNQYAILKEASTAGIHLLMLSILIPNRDMQGCYFAPFLNALNGQIESHARETELGGFLDLNRFLSDPENGLLPAFTLDGLHLNKFGMCSVANAVVQWLGERDVRLVLDADKPFSLGSRRGSWWYAHD